MYTDRDESDQEPNSHTDNDDKGRNADEKGTEELLDCLGNAILICDQKKKKKRKFYLRKQVVDIVQILGEAIENTADGGCVKEGNGRVHDVGERGLVHFFGGKHTCPVAEDVAGEHDDAVGQAKDDVHPQEKRLNVLSKWWGIFRVVQGLGRVVAGPDREPEIVGHACALGNDVDEKHAVGR